MAMKKREKQLLILFGLGVFLFANMMLLKALNKKKKEVSLDLIRYKSKESEQQIMLNMADFYESKRQWLQDSQLIYESRNKAITELQKDLKAEAVRQSVTITHEEIKDVREEDGYMIASIQVSATAGMRELVNWLYLIQRPRKFQAVTNLRFRTPRRRRSFDEVDEEKIEAEILVTKWYSLSGASSVTSS